MRLRDDAPMDPDVAAALDAMDAAVAGEPVDPDHLELGELAAILAEERARPSDAFASSLDRRVERRFERPRTTRRRLLPWAPAAGLAAAVLIAVVIVASGPGSSSGPEVVSTAAGSSAAKAPLPGLPAPPAARLGAAAASGSSGAASSAAVSIPQPPPNGRKTVQGAQLSLSAAPSRVETVSQEVFGVVGHVNGVVESSSVTAGSNAQFQLSIPSGSLAQAMTALSSLRFASVASRTDTSRDVNDQYQADVRQLADARALRTSLLKQLANATTQAEINSLTARIHDAEASISSDEAALKQLNHQIGFSQLSLTIDAGAAPAPVSHGFTIGKAAHDAGKVLTVSAGVVLIGLAVLLPIALLTALALAIASAVRRRRREQALDPI